MMYEEALSAGQSVLNQGYEAAEILSDIGQKLAKTHFQSVLTVARGSSDHAAAYMAYLIMQKLGIPVTSLPMSLVTLHQTPMQVRNQLAIAISQSGASPDLIETMSSLRAAGARTMALVNARFSPLSEVCEWEIPLCAGIEKSVAATKSFIASLTAAARLVAYWKDDASLLNALQTLPEKLSEAARNDWSKAIPLLQDHDRIMVVGRGLSFPVALEAALKFKETCGIQAEAFSSAEIRHGPMALISADYPLLVFAPRGAEQHSILALANDMRTRGAKVILAAPADVAERDLTLNTADDEALDPILAIQSFYPMAAALSIARGLHPDQPMHLSKVTRTL